MIVLNEASEELFQRWPNADKLVENLVDACCRKFSIEPPTIRFDNDQQNANNPLGKTAYYAPDEQLVVVFISNRHIKDIMRSLTHELIHHKQMMKGELDLSNADNPYYAQENDSLRNSEKEAYLKGNMIFRDWEDSIKKKQKQSTLRENKRMYSKEKLKKIKEIAQKIQAESKENPLDKQKKDSDKKLKDMKKDLGRAGDRIQKTDDKVQKKSKKLRKKFHKIFKEGPNEEVKRGVEGPKQKARQKDKYRKDSRKDDREIKKYMDTYHAMKSAENDSVIDLDKEDYSIEENAYIARIQEQEETEKALKESYLKKLGKENFLSGLKKIED